MNLHLALKTIWTVETDAGPLRLRLKHFKPKQKKPQKVSPPRLYLSTHKDQFYTPAWREGEKKKEVVIVLHQLLGL